MSCSTLLRASQPGYQTVGGESRFTRKMQKTLDTKHITAIVQGVIASHTKCESSQQEFMLPVQNKIQP